MLLFQKLSIVEQHSAVRAILRRSMTDQLLAQIDFIGRFCRRAASLPKHRTAGSRFPHSSDKRRPSRAERLSLSQCSVTASRAARAR